MFDKMQLLPLMQGLTLQEFNNIIVNLKLDFNQWNEGDVIVNQGDQCNNLIYVIDGVTECELHDEHIPMILTETIDTMPHLLEPYNLFGVKRSYERTYSFRTPGATFTINRDYFVHHMLSNMIIRSNYVNYLCNTLRKSKTLQQITCHRGVEEKLIAAITSYCISTTGEKNVKTKMNDLANLIDETRLNVSGILNQWKEMGLIELRRFGFTIKRMEDMQR